MEDEKHQRNDVNNKQYTFIDLFAGCGGLSEGFYQDGYRALLHLEIDKQACETLRERMRYYGYSEQNISKAVLCHDITDDHILSILIFQFRFTWIYGKVEKQNIIRDME